MTHINKGIIFSLLFSSSRLFFLLAFSFFPFDSLQSSCLSLLFTLLFSFLFFSLFSLIFPGNSTREMEYKKKKKKNDAIFQNPGTRFRASLSSTFITVFPLRFARVSLPHLFRYAALTGTLQARPKAGKQAHRALYLFYCGFLGVSSRVPWQLCARRPTFSPGIGLHQNKIKCNGCCFFCHG